MRKRSGYPSVEQFRVQIAPYLLAEVGRLRGVICAARFPLNTREWKAGMAVNGHLDEFVGAECGYPALFHAGSTNPTPRPAGPVSEGTEEWWRRKIAEARRPE